MYSRARWADELDNHVQKAPGVEWLCQKGHADSFTRGGRLGRLVTDDKHRMSIPRRRALGVLVRDDERHWLQPTNRRAIVAWWLLDHAEVGALPQALADVFAKIRVANHEQNSTPAVIHHLASRARRHRGEKLDFELQAIRRG